MQRAVTQQVSESRHARRRRRMVFTAVAVMAAALLAGAALAKPGKTAADPISVNIIPIANTLPLDIGIKQGFFAAQGLEVKKVVLQSGNDIMLALANSKGEIGFAGWVPAMIARTSGLQITAITTSEVEGTNAVDNWQNILVKGSSSIQSPADLAGKTIAVNALKGVGEVMIRAALEKSGVDPNSIKLLAVPFPAMRAALANGQVDAVWTPEPFLSQILSDGGRIVMAPGPVLGRYFPIGGYFARSDWAANNPALAKKFATAMNQSLEYAQTHSGEVRELLPPALRSIRLPIWTTLVDRRQLLEPRGLREEVRRHQHPAQPHPARAEHDRRGKDAAGVGRGSVHHASTGRQARDEAQGGEVPDRGHRQIGQAELPARWAGRGQEHRHRIRGPDDPGRSRSSRGRTGTARLAVPQPRRPCS